MGTWQVGKNSGYNNKRGDTLSSPGLHLECAERTAADSQLRVTNDTDSNQIGLTLGSGIKALMFHKVSSPRKKKPKQSLAPFCSPSVQPSLHLPALGGSCLPLPPYLSSGAAERVTTQSAPLSFARPIIAIKRHYGCVNACRGEGVRGRTQSDSRPG